MFKENIQIIILTMLSNNENIKFLMLSSISFKICLLIFVLMITTCEMGDVHNAIYIQIPFFSNAIHATLNTIQNLF